MRRIVVLPEELEVIVNRLSEIEKVLKKEQHQVEDPILDTEGVITLLKVSKRSLQNWRDQGLIEFSAIVDIPVILTTLFRCKLTTLC